MIPMPRRGTSEGDGKMSGWKCPQYATITFAAMLLLAGCVSQQKYDALDTNISNSTRRCRGGRRQPDADHALAKRH
jgi:hypothetical protein